MTQLRPFGPEISIVHEPFSLTNSSIIRFPFAASPRPKTFSPNCFSSCFTALSRGAQICSAFADDADINKADAAMRLKMILISLVLSLGATRWATPLENHRLYSLPEI